MIEDKEKSNSYNFEELMKTSLDKKIPFYKNPSMAYIKPFRIFGNLYYIGDKKVCSHLVDTSEGLIVFDSGYQHTIHLLVQSIWELGFNPSDIKYLIHTHGHYDHFGACNEFRSLYRCTTVMSHQDAEMMKTKPSGALMNRNPNPYAQLPIIDKTFEDGEVIELGNTKINCVLTPGHSPGNSSFFFNISDETGQSYRVGYYGGTGFKTIHKDFLTEQDFPLTLREDFKTSIEKIVDEPVDIVLVGHPAHNNLLDKREIMLRKNDGNPFINPNEWKEFLDRLVEKYKKFLQEEI